MGADEKRMHPDEYVAHEIAMSLERNPLRSKVRADVFEFHAMFEHPISREIGFNDPKTNELRKKLILEEAQEFADAVDAGDFVEAVDAIADLLYVVEGTVLAFGLHQRGAMNAVSDEVHASNMSKLGPDGKPIRREDGKTLKGPNFFEPRIAEILRQLGWKGEEKK